MSVPGLETRDVFNHTGHTAEWGGWDGSGDNGENELERRRGVGIELDSIPLCNVCSAETAAESRDQVLARGLECISEFDGGLSRNRLDMLTELADEREGEIILTRRLHPRTSRRLRSATGIEQDLRRYINGSSGWFVSSNLQNRKIKVDPRQRDELVKSDDPSSLLGNAADMGKISDGTMGGEQWYVDRSATSSDQFQEQEQFDVYVSVLDPVGEPAFKPSKFKPLPSWMNLLPNNVHRGRGQKNDIFLACTGQQQPRSEPFIENDNSSSIESPRNSRCSPIDLVDSLNLRGGGRTIFPLSSPEKSRKQREKRAVSFESAHTADDAGAHQCPRASESTIDAIYSVPSDHRSYNSRLPRRRTPYPQDFPRLSTLQKDASVSVSQRNSSITVEEAAHEPCCELGLQLRQRRIIHGQQQPLHSRREGRVSSERCTPSMCISSEYLDRNQLQCPRPETHHHAAGKGETKLRSHRRQKAGEHNRGKSIRNKRKNKMTNGTMDIRMASEG